MRGNSAWLARGFDDDGRAVGEDFGDARHDLRRVVADADDGVGAELCGVRKHELESVAAGSLAQAGVEGDVTAENRLDARREVPYDGARAHDDAAHDTQILGDAVAVDGKRGGGEGVLDAGLRHGAIIAENQARGNALVQAVGKR